MPNLIDKITGSIVSVFSSPVLGDQGTQHLAALHRNLIKPESAKLRVELASRFADMVLPPDNPCGLNMFLFDVTGDSVFIQKAIRNLPNISNPAAFNDLYWNISRREFLHSSISRPYEEVLRERFHQVADAVKAAADATVEPWRRKTARRPLNVVILSACVLGMRHSPTREAFSFAIHLTRNHGCRVHLFNTNAMVYSNTLNLFDPFVANLNPGFSGRQRVLIDYLQFKSCPVQLVSFPAGQMGTAKVASVIRAAQELDVDVILSHGENLLIGEAFFGKVPSLFATTGGIVPFARSNANWVPASLVTDDHRRLAARFGHGELLLESMFSTPESPSDGPANRTTFEVAASDILLLCVSTRLETELEQGFVAALSTVMSRHRDVRILFAGSPGANVKSRFPAELAARVSNIGFQDDLSSVSQMCDIYVNLHRQGGGTSAQTAILSGLPVVTLNFGHISDIVPFDRRHETWDAYTAYLDGIVSDPALRASEAAYVKEAFLGRQETGKQMEKVYRKLCELSGLG